jgi:hypothetical protein
MVFTWDSPQSGTLLVKKNTPVFCATKHKVCACVTLKKLTSAIYKKK